MPTNAEKSTKDDIDQNKLTVYHDGACPKCRRTSKAYEKLPVRQQVCCAGSTLPDRISGYGI
ncbi:hypothetical protein GO003_000090 [Methylicorpusculum oleiharenae]|uniref:hypothetical protein n=1 Tax=Methylicorpusculum oleiharenae TaxID=1338687 RepID=UPI001E40D96C|nr:hypothetical protein [Methylicorpusculum oleiharenae]MCD2448802.1 hypothetical protein [Methylicorpusculum oleiharenae]